LLHIAAALTVDIAYEFNTIADEDTVFVVYAANEDST
jgi:arginine repressor